MHKGHWFGLRLNQAKLRFQQNPSECSSWRFPSSWCICLWVDTHLWHADWWLRNRFPILRCPVTACGFTGWQSIAVMNLSEAPCCTGHCGHWGFDSERNKRNVRWCFTFSGGGQSNGDVSQSLCLCSYVVTWWKNSIFFNATEGLVDSWWGCKVKNCTVSCFQCLRRWEKYLLKKEYIYIKKLYIIYIFL